jgi:hypothetical protein
MKKITLSIITTVSIIFLISSCKKDDNNSCSNNNYMKFLKVGNYWSYNLFDALTSEDSIGMKIESQPSAGTYFMKIYGAGTPVQIGGDKRYMKECNDWFMVDPTSEPDDNDKVYPAVRSLNQTWTVGNSTYVVVGKDVSVTVPAGTFTADKLTFHSAGTINTDTIWFSNDVGYIKYVGLVYDYELRSKNF